MTTSQANSDASDATGESTARYVRAVLGRALLVTLVAALAFYVAGGQLWARGLALGGLASAANFVALAWFTPRALLGGRGWGVGSLALRFGLMAAALAVALTHPDRFSPWATAAGLFVVQVTLLLEHVIGGRGAAHSLGSR